MFARALPLHVLNVDPSSMPIGLFFIPLIAEIVAHSDLDWNFGWFVSPSYQKRSIHRSVFIRQKRWNYLRPLLPARRGEFTISRRSLPALKRTFFDAGMVIFSFVRGLRPSRALR